MKVEEDNIIWLLMERIEHLVERAQDECIDPELSAFLLEEAKLLANTADELDYQFLYLKGWI